MTSRTVLITGCSTGIGRATARKLADEGHTVYATARKLSSIEDLDGCRKLALDVTDEESMKRAVAVVEEAEGAAGVLVNNAGYGLHGAFETAPIEEIRRQFETNVIGLARLTQLVLPGMRKQGWGRIVNISSMGGKLSFPGGAFYHGTKHALEAMSDVMRFELKPFGIDVVVVLPGIVRTNFSDTALATVAETEGPYASFHEGLESTFHNAYEGPLSRFGVSMEAVAKTIVKAVSTRRPRTRYVVPFPITSMILLRRLLPDRAFDAVLRTAYSPPEKPRV